MQELAHSMSNFVHKGCSLSVAAYNMLITSLGKADNVQEATKLLDKMLENRCVPHVVTHTFLIKSLKKQGKVQVMETSGKLSIESLKMKGKVHVMLTLGQGYIPNDEMYNILIEGLDNEVKPVL